jgi:hypothetical protein
MPNLNSQDFRMTVMVEPFLEYAKTELCLADQTISKYRDCLRQVVRMLGDRPLPEYRQQDVLHLKADMLGRKLSVGRQVAILAALKGVLSYARHQCDLPALNSASITFPKRPRREVSAARKPWSGALKNQGLFRSACTSAYTSAAQALVRPLVQPLVQAANRELGPPMTIGDVATLIGCSPWTVRHTLLRRGLPHFRCKASGRLIFYRDQVIRWIEKIQEENQ